jgi:hypothetical protein
MPDERGRYRFDEMGNDNLPEYLGYLIGYMNEWAALTGNT